MRINELSVKNYRSIKKANLKLSKGINIFSGVPGQGKSSLIEAIRLLLINSCYTKLSSIPNRDSGSKSFSLSMDVDFGSTNLYLSGKLSGSSLKRELIKNKDKDNTLTDSDVVEELSTLFDFDLIEGSVFSHQGDNSITSITPAKRRDFLKKILKIDFKEQIDYLDNTLNSLKEELTQNEVDIKVLENKEYPYMSNKNIPFTENEIEEFKKTIEEYTKFLANIEKLKEEYNSKKIKLKEIENEIGNLYSNLSSKKSLLEEKNTLLNSKETELSTTDFDKDISLLHAKKDNEQKDLQKRIDELTNEHDSIVVSRLRKFDSSLKEEVEQKHLSLVNKKYVIDKELSNMLKGDCPTCGRPFPVDDIESYKQEKESLDKEIQEIGLQLYNLKQEEESYNLKKEKNNELINKKASLQQTIDNTKEKMFSLDSTYREQERLLKENISSKKENISQTIEHLKTSIVDLQSQIDELEERINNKKSEQSTLSDSIEDNKNFDEIDEYKQKINSLQKNIDDYKDVLSYNNTVKETNDNLDIKQKEDKKVLKSLHKQKGEISEKINACKEAKVFYTTSFPNYIITYMLSSIKTNMNKFMIQAYNGRYVIDIKENNRKTGIDILYGSPDGVLDDTMNASGFEKSLLKTSWLVGLMNLSNINLMILDEIDAAAPAEYAEALYDIIGEYSKKIDQMIVISHKSEIREFLKNNYDAKEFLVDKGEVYEV